jgi:RNA polymerase sigma-70 factor (ECF subfamily)
MPDQSYDIQQLRDRDASAWDTLYTANCQRTYRVLFHVTGAPPPVLEELNQEVWLSAMESVEQLDASRGTAQEWILGIARFKGLTYLRKQYANRLAFVGSSANLPEESDEPKQDNGLSERIAVLRALIESLPDNWQYVLRQKYELGMSVKQIAELLNVTPKAIESILSRARQRLRELSNLTGEGGADDAA